MSSPGRSPGRSLPVGAGLLGLGWMLAVGWPALAMLRAALAEPADEVPGGLTRPLTLALESLRLVGLTELFALPPGIALGWLAFRTDLPGRRRLVGLLGLVLFIPLPLHAMAWLGAFGNLGREQALGSRPWLTGLTGAAFVHAMAALPWVALAAGVGFLAVEPELEDAARLEGPGPFVFRRVSLRRSLRPLAAAALAVAVLTAGEMTVTDLITVPGPLRTYAEEAYTLAQLGLAQGQRAVRTTAPQLVVLALLVRLAAQGLNRLDPARALSARATAGAWPLGRWRRPLGLTVWLATALGLGLPLYGLAWRAGRVGAPARPGIGPSWSLAGLGGSLSRAAADLVDLGSLPLAPLGTALLRALVVAALVVLAGRTLGRRARDTSASRRWLPGLALVLGLLAAGLSLPAGTLPLLVQRLPRTYLFGSLLWAGLGACLSVALAWPLAWRAAHGRAAWAGLALLSLALLLAVPGPIAGLALKRAYVSFRIANQTPLLLTLAYAVRSLPYALLVLLPAARAVPATVLDAAAVDGLAPGPTARRVGLPWTRPALAAAGLVAFALALGELSAAYFTRAPGFEPVALYVWGLLHVGVESRLAGAGLILLALLAAIGALAAGALRRALGIGPDPGGGD